MIRSIIRFSAENRYLVLLASAVVAAFGIYTLQHIPVDAIPDLSDTQVIVYSRWDRSPDIIEDQVTYPIVSALLGTPNVKTIRGFSDFGFSYVYIIFKDGTDIYWARSRVLEYLSKIQPLLPQGVRTEIGPDATGVGWVYQYVLVDDSGTHSLADLRTFQDWNLRYRLQSVPGVAEVASIGGFVQQYQVTVDPTSLRSFELSITEVAEAVRQSNSDVGGRLLEFAGREFMVRGRGYVRSKEDLEKIVLKTDARGTPVLLRDVGSVAIGPEMRRGISDLDGQGDAVGGIVVMRHGENAREVIGRVKTLIKDIGPSLPAGVRLVPTYDRSDLIQRSIDTLKHELLVEIAIVSLVILIFLWHIPSAIVPIITIPVSVLLAFIPMRMMGISSNIMSLAGIAISIGVLVDGAIVEVENAYKKLETLGARRAPGRLSCGAPRSASGGRAIGLLLAARDRGRVPPDLHPGRPGRAPVHAARVDEEPRAVHRGPAGPDARPRAPHALRENGLLHVPAEAARVDRQPGDRWQVLPGGTAPDQPAALRRVRAGVQVRAEVSEGDHHHGRPHRDQHRSRLPEARPRVHAAAQRGHDSLHADHAAWHLGDGGRPTAAEAGRDPEVLPRGDARVRQGGTGGDIDRPRPVLDDGDGRVAEAGVGMEVPGAVVLGPGARVAAGVAAASHLAGPDVVGGTGRRDGRRAADSGHDQRVDDAHQGAD